MNNVLHVFVSYMVNVFHMFVLVYGSCPGKFYGTSKFHKLPENGNVDKLPIRPVASNIGTASYQLAKYLAKLLPPLSQSQYTVKSTKDFIQKIHNVNECSPRI